MIGRLATRTRVRLESLFCWLGLGLESPCTMTRTRTPLFGLGLVTRIAIPQYFSQSYGAYFKYIVCTCTCAYTYCKCLRDVNDILRHIKIRAIWLAEMQSSFAEEKKSQPGTQRTKNMCTLWVFVICILGCRARAPWLEARLPIALDHWMIGTYLI